MRRIVIFASGSGSNAENIIKYFISNNLAKVTHVLSNKIDAKVLTRAAKYNIKALHFDRASFYDSKEVLHIVEDAKPDLIVLAGFLWKFPENFIENFPDKIINIHPSLLPKYGGKGMYGGHVHKAVVENKEKETGITIHYVNSNYDEGGVIFQKSVLIKPTDTPDHVAEKVLELEHLYFPKVIESILYPKQSKSV